MLASLSQACLISFKNADPSKLVPTQPHSLLLLASSLDSSSTLIYSGTSQYLAVKTATYASYVEALEGIAELSAPGSSLLCGKQLVGQSPSRMVYLPFVVQFIILTLRGPLS